MKSKRIPESAVYVLEKMAHGFNRMGRSDGRGFYDYDDGDSPQLWPGLKAFERRATRISDDDIRDRLVYAAAIEALRCLQEGVVATAADANTASILGCGFPPDGKGVLGLVDESGPQTFVARARELADAYGSRFAPPAIVVELARRGESL